MPTGASHHDLARYGMPSGRRLSDTRPKDWSTEALERSLFEKAKLDGRASLPVSLSGMEPVPEPTELREATAGLTVRRGTAMVDSKKSCARCTRL